MKIVVPAFYGKHTYENYETVQRELNKALEEKEIALFADYLFIGEVETYFQNIFVPAVFNHRNKKIHIESRDKKRLRKIMQLLRRNVIEYDKKITMKKGKYRFCVLT